MTKKKRRKIVRKLDGLAPLPGAEYLRERLRVLERGARIMVLEPVRIEECLREVDQLRASGFGRVDLPEDAGAARQAAGEGRKILVRFADDVIELVNDYAAASGAREPLSFAKAVNVVLRSALGTRLERARKS